MSGTLFIVATPIGNLGDISERALEVLKSADLVLTEDTRQSAKLLGSYGIETPMRSYHQHTGEGKKLEILGELLTGKNIALVTDAGTPGISDPGNELIDFLLSRADLKIVPIPGASAPIAALSVSGFRAGEFLFLGFFPRKKREKLIAQIKDLGCTFVFFESPHRISKTLDYLGAVFGAEKRILVARELTKIHETLYRGSIEKVKIDLEKDTVKGEFVVVVEGD